MREDSTNNANYFLLILDKQIWVSKDTTANTDTMTLLCEKSYSISTIQLTAVGTYIDDTFT